MTMNWYRAYHGMPYDPKLAVVAKRAGARRGDVAAVWAACLDYASQAEDRGSIHGIDPEEIAVAFDYETDYVFKIIQELYKKEMVSDDDHLEAWERRNPKREREDDSIERVRKHRESQKQVVTPCNATVTPGNAQIREEEIREEEKKEEPPVSPSGDLFDDSPPDKILCEVPTVRAALKVQAITDAKTTPDPSGVVRPAVSPPKKKPKAEMSEEQRAWFRAFLDLHPKNTIQTASATRLWAERVKTVECFEFLLACLRRECAGDTTYMLGPGKWLADHLELYANGVAPSSGVARSDPVTELAKSNLRKYGRLFV